MALSVASSLSISILKVGKQKAISICGVQKKLRLVQTF
jgi:hypothetical protein